MTALADLLISESALLLYFSESGTRSRNSTIVPFFRICRYLCLCFTIESIFGYCGDDSQDKTR